jgi:antirestriction protein
MHIKAGTGFASGIITIISNTATTLTYATQSFTPDTTTCYKIHDTWGLCTAATASSLTETSTKNWQVNGFGGKRCKIIAGTGTTGVEAIVQTNTATALTVNTNGLTAGDTTTVYAIH